MVGLMSSRGGLIGKGGETSFVTRRESLFIYRRIVVDSAGFCTEDVMWV